MRALKHQPWNIDPHYEETVAEVDWNLWGRRHWPFNHLEVGDTVFLVCRDAAGASLVSWQVEILKVIAEEYETKREAFEIVTSAFPVLLEGGFRRRDFLAQPYTKDAPDRGFVLAYNYEPIRQIGIPRPGGLRLMPTGWASLDGFTDTEMRQLGLLGASARRRPQGGRWRPPPRQPDPLRRVAVEKRAMAVANRELLARGWKLHEIVDTSKTCSYDFECRRGRRSLRVEVKGLSGPLGGVTLTRREVENARSSPVALIVVHGITVAQTSVGIRATGGTAVVFDPWRIDDGHLDASAFDYQLPPLP